MDGGREGGRVNVSAESLIVGRQHSWPLVPFCCLSNPPWPSRPNSSISRSMSSMCTRALRTYNLLTHLSSWFGSPDSCFSFTTAPRITFAHNPKHASLHVSLWLTRFRTMISEPAWTARCRGVNLEASWTLEFTLAWTLIRNKTLSMSEFWTATWRKFRPLLSTYNNKQVRTTLLVSSLKKWDPPNVHKLSGSLEKSWTTLPQFQSSNSKCHPTPITTMYTHAHDQKGLLSWHLPTVGTGHGKPRRN